MNIHSTVKAGAKATLTIGLAGNSIRHIRIVASSVEERDEAMVRVRRVLPALEMMERLLLLQEPIQTVSDKS